MASYELTPFQRFDEVMVVAAIEQQSTLINVGFWVKDPAHHIIWPTQQTSLHRKDFLWTETCFEIFIGIRHQDGYREINLAPTEAWQTYQFEEYRYPDTSPPQHAHDIEIVELKRTPYGINTTIDVQLFLTQHQIQVSDLYLGLSVILNTDQGDIYYALQHSGLTADFHNKRDWLHQL